MVVGIKGLFLFIVSSFCLTFLEMKSILLSKNPYLLSPLTKSTLPTNLTVPKQDRVLFVPSLATKSLTLTLSPTLISSLPREPP